MGTAASRSTRLASYTALAGVALPVSAATAAFSGGPLNLTVGLGDAPFGIDFGAGFGEIFSFAVEDQFNGVSSSYSRITAGLVRFNPGNSGGWTAASLIQYNAAKPQRLSLSDPVSAGNSNWASIGTGSNFEHKLAARSINVSFYGGYGGGSSGDWAPDQRGFIGLRFTKDTGANFHYAWLDVEASGFQFGPGRTAAGSLHILGYGLETTPNRPLPAGAPAPGPAGLALLAMGAAGIRRTRRTAA